MVCMSVTYCLFKIVMLQKIKNTDTSHKQGDFLEMKTVI